MGLAEGPQPALDQGRVGQHPAVQGGVVDLEAALQEQLLDVTVAQGIAQVPRDGLQDQRRLEVPALEIILGAALQLLGNRAQDHGAPPVRRDPCGPHAQRGVNAKTCDSPVVSPAVMATSVTVFVLALTTVIVPGGPFCFGLGFGAAASGAAAASAGADPGTSGMLITGCATAGVRPRTRAAQANPVRRE